MIKSTTLLKVGEPGRSERKHRAILDAAAEIFLHQGFSGTSMDEIAARAAVSKQTVYKHFESKETLFIGVVQSMTDQATGRVQTDMHDATDADALREQLRAYAERQLMVVLTPPLMQLRRLVIAEVMRFPELGRTLYEAGPGNAIAILSAAFARWAERGLLIVDDPLLAATHFNWLVMGDAVNQVMMRGDSAIPPPATLRRQAVEAVRVFLAAYGNPAN